MAKLQKEEKKVEYLELIYDLIFVYIIGRNNALLHQVENGFVSRGLFLSYVHCTLAVIQIWNFSTFYINRYGRNGAREYGFLFVNMYLLYYMGEGTGTHWQTAFYRYHAAWVLILVNIGLQYVIELKDHAAVPWECMQIRRSAAILLAEAVLVGAHILFYRFTGASAVMVPILFGILATALSGRVNSLVMVDFPHLTERAMLYVVFTFGEMIIAISSYFTETLTLNTVYFSLMAFLIVAGLFLSYGLFYNRILDRERSTNGTGYMLLHVFLIFALNNLSAALEFMHDASVALWPKTLFLTGSFVLYYSFLFLLGRYAKKCAEIPARFCLFLPGVMAGFIALMLLFREQMYVNIAITAAYVYGILAVMYRYGIHLGEAAE